MRVVFSAVTPLWNIGTQLHHVKWSHYDFYRMELLTLQLTPFELKVEFLLDWLTTKAREHNLISYL